MKKQVFNKKLWPLFLQFLLMLFFLLSFSNLLFAQQKVITGKVEDGNNTPLESVSITVKGKPNIGTITDAKGNFSIQVSPNEILVFNHIGYQQQEMKIGTSASLNVILTDAVVNLNEVIVIGYGTKLKGELTGAISKVDSKVFETRPLTNTMNALQGALPGVTVTRGSGRPGSENYSLQIRGASSIGGSKVLILIDGVPGDLNLLNPNDIAGLTVLKDAAASIYGARAADGVVLVTTKKGRQGPPSISYSGNYGIKKPQFLKKRTNTLQMAEMYDEGMKNVGQPGVSQAVFDKIKANAEPDIASGWIRYLENFPGFYQSHNWNDAVYGTGVQQMHNISISGGGDNNTYLFSAGYERNEGTFKHGENHSDRYNLRLNYDFKLSNRINIETRTSFENQLTVEPTAIADILLMVNQTGSYVPVFNPKGQLYKYQGGFRNPVQYLEEAGLRKTNDYKLLVNIKGNIEVFNNLKLVAQVGVNLGFNDGNTTNPSFAQHNWDGSNFDVVNVPNNANYLNSKNLYQIATGYLDYNKILFNKHKFNLMAGASHEVNDLQSQSITGFNFASNEIFTLNLADRTKTEYSQFSGNASDWALQSYFGRFSYSFDRKYMLDFTTRVDGSSKFAPNKRWSALFPSIAIAWNLSEENFIKSLNTFNDFKIRASWGQSGNQELSFGNYDYISLVSIIGTYPFGSTRVGLPGAVSNIVSKERTWETIETKNVGLDFAFFDSRLKGSIDYYIKNNKNMLVTDQLPATLGGAAPSQNIGKLETKGWDFSIGWNDKIGEFKYGVSAMLSDSKNKLIELKGNDSYREGLVFAREGYSLNSYFGYQFDGIIKNSEQLADYKKLANIPSDIGMGDVMYRDIDGDGKITAFGDPSKGTKGDMMYLGNLLPDIFIHQISIYPIKDLI